MNAYSEDLRRKIVEAVERGMGKSQAACTFGVCLSSVERYAKMARDYPSRAPKKRPGSLPKIDEGSRRLLGGRPGGLSDRHAARKARVSGEGIRAEDERVDRQQDAEAPRMEPKKDHWERTREFLKAAWRVLVAGGLDARRLVFVDEMGAHTSLTSLYAWARRGERVRVLRCRATEERTRRCWRV